MIPCLVSGLQGRSNAWRRGGSEGYSNFVATAGREGDGGQACMTQLLAEGPSDSGGSRGGLCACACMRACVYVYIVLCVVCVCGYRVCCVCAYHVCVVCVYRVVRVCVCLHTRT